jgi:DNA-binding CsgD family transcriptional regulator
MHSIQLFWNISTSIGRLKYIFLVLFTNSLYTSKAKSVCDYIMIAIIVACIASSYYVYSILPNLVAIITVLYVLLSCYIIYRKRKTFKLSVRRIKLLYSLLICSSIFLIGIVLDVLKEIPQASIYISIIGVDFNPLYTLVIGIIVIIWAYRDLFEKDQDIVSSIDEIRFAGNLPVTSRENEVIMLILSGDSNSTIAEKLFISESTVKKHINNIFRKLHINSRWELLKLVNKIHLK